VIRYQSLNFTPWHCIIPHHTKNTIYLQRTKLTLSLTWEVLRKPSRKNKTNFKQKFNFIIFFNFQRTSQTSRPKRTSRRRTRNRWSPSSRSRRPRRSHRGRTRTWAPRWAETGARGSPPGSDGDEANETGADFSTVRSAEIRNPSRRVRTFSDGKGDIRASTKNSRRRIFILGPLPNPGKTSLKILKNRKFDPSLTDLADPADRRRTKEVPAEAAAETEVEDILKLADRRPTDSSDPGPEVAENRPTLILTRCRLKKIFVFD